MDKITKKEHEKRLSAQACRMAYFKKYYKKNRRWIIESQRVYKERNFERIAEYQKSYQKAYRAKKKLEKLNNIQV